jgi:methylated-DNA-protein-cysteine methyltransferase-like protein
MRATDHGGTEERETFYDRVYEFVRLVPEGRVVTYGQVALELGSPAAARAVGYALANLPGASEVPWWRVVNARGGISPRGHGFAAHVQREQLEAEGVRFDLEGNLRLREYRWVTAQ